MNGTLNLLANKYCNEYEYVCFIGDDHRPRTDGWDLKLIESIIFIGIQTKQPHWTSLKNEG
jgi:hypothetical protein